MVADQVRGLVQGHGVLALQLDLNVLALGRAALWQAQLGEHTRRLAQPLTDGRDDVHAGQAELFFHLEIDELELDAADGVVRRAVAAAAVQLPGPHVDGAHALDADQLVLDLADQGVGAFHRQIAPRHDVDRRVIRVLFQEELAVVLLDEERRNDRGDHAHRRQSDHQRPATGGAQSPGVPAHEAAHLGRVAVLRLLDLGQVRQVRALLAPHQRTQRRCEDQRHEDRRPQGEEQGERQEAHELARNRVPEQEGQEGAQGGQGAVDHRPEHALAGGGESVSPVQALGHLPVGVLHHHDAPVDQDAHRQHQAEHHHLIEGDVHLLEAQEGDHEAGGDRRPDHDSLPHPQGRDDDQHHQQGGRDQARLQHGQGVGDELALVEGIVGVDRAGPVLAFLQNRGPDRADGVE